MDQITIERIKRAHPALRDKMLEDYLYINNRLLGRGVRLRYAWVYRTPAEQNKLYKKRPKVTNAQAWQSIHNYGLAFDIVLLYDKDGNGTFETASWDMKYDGDRDLVADWMEVTMELEKRGWQNGFVRNGKKWDFPHFQKDYGYSWRQLKTKIDAGQYTTEVIDGQTYMYPVL